MANESRVFRLPAGMRMATTVQMIRMDDNLNVTVGQGEWSDKIGAGALGWFIAWPLAVTAGVGAYSQRRADPFPSVRHQQD